jgi:hypothetical protein
MANNITTACNNKYTSGYSNGVTDADNRVNTSSASYSSGYNNGASAAKYISGCIIYGSLGGSGDGSSNAPTYDSYNTNYLSKNSDVYIIKVAGTYTCCVTCGWQQAVAYGYTTAYKNGSGFLGISGGTNQSFASTNVTFSAGDTFYTRYSSSGSNVGTRGGCILITV